jgi:hypothetical protein
LYNSGSDEYSGLSISGWIQEPCNNQRM